MFVLLLSPLTRVAEATALALVARVVHTAADALMAAGWWYAVQLNPPTSQDRVSSAGAGLRVSEPGAS